MRKPLLKNVYYFIITILFVYILVEFLTLSEKNWVYHFYSEYILNSYCLILYIVVSLFIFRLDRFTGVLLFLLLMGPVKVAVKEYFVEMFVVSGSVSNELTEVENREIYGLDDRFKMDNVANREILRQIKAQVDFDPYKTELSKSVIYEIYNKYFDNDVFVKLKEVDDDSKSYVAAGNFTYLPKSNQADYDLITYQNLSATDNIGLNPIVDKIGVQRGLR